MLLRNSIGQTKASVDEWLLRLPSVVSDEKYSPPVRWWHTPLVPALGRQRQVNLWVRGQPGLQSRFQDSQDYTEKPCLEKSKNSFLVCGRLLMWSSGGPTKLSPSQLSCFVRIYCVACPWVTFLRTSYKDVFHFFLVSLVPVGFELSPLLEVIAFTCLELKR